MSICELWYRSSRLFKQNYWKFGYACSTRHKMMFHIKFTMYFFKWTWLTLLLKQLKYQCCSIIQSIFFLLLMLIQLKLNICDQIKFSRKFVMFYGHSCVCVCVYGNKWLINTCTAEHNGSVLIKLVIFVLFFCLESNVRSMWTVIICSRASNTHYFTRFTYNTDYNMYWLW